MTARRTWATREAQAMEKIRRLKADLILMEKKINMCAEDIERLLKRDPPLAVFVEVGDVEVLRDVAKRLGKSMSHIQQAEKLFTD
jgi:hypothetical protein